MKGLSSEDKSQLRTRLGIKKFTSKESDRMRQQLKQYKENK
jgi:hypothetical protein